MADIRIGHGYDVHSFQAGDYIILGGVKIPHHQAFKAHSDGDVLIHAICDALLGAAALGDIGQHFPDTDPQYRDADSRLMLRHVVSLVTRQGYRLGNLDATLVAQTPKMSAHIPAMKSNLASDLGCDINLINVKATTTEKLGFVGREEGIAAHAVLIIQN